MTHERDIIHENGVFWVLRKNGVFYVMVVTGTHSISDSAYPTADLAVARCDYMAGRSRSAVKIDSTKC